MESGLHSLLRYCTVHAPAAVRQLLSLLRRREGSFGHAILQLINTTTATFTWHRNQDGAPVVGDFATIVRDTTACPCALPRRCALLN